MLEVDLPAGTYLSLSGRIRAGKGGQTRAVLMRNRLFARAGVEPMLLTVDNSTTYPRTRAALARDGLLIEPMRLLNIFEWYRGRDVEHLEVVDSTLPEIDPNAEAVRRHPDGTVYVTRTKPADGAILDYHRPDGSVFLRIQRGPAANSIARVVLTNTSGQPVVEWSSKGGWYRHWLRELVPPGQNAFVISDARRVLGHVLPMDDPRFHVMHLMHNTHTVGSRAWNSEIASSYAPLLHSIKDLDGLVSLTCRQREDVAMRFGPTDNLFAVPNPVEMPVPPEPLPKRAAMGFAIVSRLHRKKRLEHAVRAFALVVRQEPDATLDIVGDGPAREMLEREVDALHLRGSVTFHGYDPRARDRLWAATGFLMTSIFEGYPLATLESMSHGCPVISYDIKYGPREQITHGTDGFLVEPGDVRGVADRCLELIRNPDLAAKMSRAAVEKALTHDAASFLGDWREVLEATVDNKRYRTTPRSVDLDTEDRRAFHSRRGYAVRSGFSV